MSKNGLFSTIKNDIPASLVVFFVALPLCLAIAVASEAPPISGLIAGIIGGILVGAISGSKIGVSGPAAGLAAIVLVAISDLGGFDNFLVAVVIGGIIQIIFSILRLGIIGYYFPSSVIKGMLSGIGLFLILKQIPHFFGYDKEGFLDMNGTITFSNIFETVNHVVWGSALIGTISLVLLILWDKVLSKKGGIFKIVQGPIVVVALGIVFYLLTKGHEFWGIGASHLVEVPTAENISGLWKKITLPNFSAITNPQVWIVAFTIALVASLETLLCVEATDKLDPDRNVTPTNRELLAQGTGNLISGLVGGLPVTQVIVRSSANIQSGGKSKMSAIIHGFLLLISIITVPWVLNYIPLSVLAAVLLMVGYKLAKPALFKSMYKAGWQQLIPFLVTITGIIFINLLWGIGLGLAVGILIVLVKSYMNSHFVEVKNKTEESVTYNLTFAEEVTFFNKAAILKELDNIPENSVLELDITNNKFLDYDIIEILDDFKEKASHKGTIIKLISGTEVVENPSSFNELLNKKSM